MMWNLNDAKVAMRFVFERDATLADWYEQNLAEYKPHVDESVRRRMDNEPTADRIGVEKECMQTWVNVLFNRKWYKALLIHQHRRLCGSVVLDEQVQEGEDGEGDDDEGLYEE